MLEICVIRSYRESCASQQIFKLALLKRFSVALLCLAGSAAAAVPAISRNQVPRAARAATRG